MVPVIHHNILIQNNADHIRIIVSHIGCDINRIALTIFCIRGVLRKIHRIIERHFFQRFIQFIYIGDTVPFQFKIIDNYIYVIVRIFIVIGFGNKRIIHILIDGITGSVIIFIVQ